MATLRARRVFLWAHPRSRSTVFELSLASRPETKVFHELYTLAHYNSNDRHSGDATVKDPGYTYNDVIETLESDYPGKDVILSKEFALCLKGKYDDLPKGYVHTFLIRDPRRSIPSMCKVHDTVGMLADSFPPTGGMKQLHDLHSYVTSTLQQKSIVIDSTDLANQPERILRKYCEATEIPFCDSYLNWEPNNIGHWHAMWKDTPLSRYFLKAVESTHLKSNCEEDDDQQIDNSNLQHHGKLNIETALPYYNELFEKRLRP